MIGEAMLAIVLAGAALEKFGGDHMDEIRRNHDAFRESVGPRRAGGAGAAGRAGGEPSEDPAE